MHLQVGDETHSVAQLGPDFVILEHAANLAPCDAVLHFSIDGNERERPIYLPAGASAAQRRTPIAARA